MIVGIKDEATRREVSREEGFQTAKMYRCRFVEVDATNFTEVQYMFYSIIRAVREWGNLWIRNVTIDWNAT